MSQAYVVGSSRGGRVKLRRGKFLIPCDSITIVIYLGLLLDVMSISIESTFINPPSAISHLGCENVFARSLSGHPQTTECSRS